MNIFDRFSMGDLTIKQDEIIGNLCYDDSYQEDRKDG